MGKLQGSYCFQFSIPPKELLEKTQILLKRAFENPKKRCIIKTTLLQNQGFQKTNRNTGQIPNKKTGRQGMTVSERRRGSG